MNKARVMVAGRLPETALEILPDAYMQVNVAWCSTCMFIHNNIDPNHRDPDRPEPVLFIHMADRVVRVCPHCLSRVFALGGFEDLLKQGTDTGVKEEEVIEHELFQAVRNANLEPIEAGLRSGTLDGVKDGLKKALDLIGTLMSLAKN